MAQILSIQSHLVGLKDQKVQIVGNGHNLQQITLEMEAKSPTQQNGNPLKTNGNCHGLTSLPPRAAVDLEWKQLNYSVSLGRKKGTKCLLKSISGKVCSGELTAIMGPSGAGKSTLINVLTGFVHRNIGGQILVNGKERNLKVFKKLSCYIMQDDHLLPVLTVKESLFIAANLKIPASISKEQKKDIVTNVIESLSLSECQDTRAGNLSGGQRKRLCIAQEMVNNPPVLFLDEPTSGLDSSSCLQCINLLKGLAQEGRTIVCTIHQPSARVLETFDRLYMLAEGNCIFNGPVVKLLPFLSAQGLDCPQYHNPADFVTEVAVGEYGYLVDKLVNAVNSSNSWSDKDNQSSSLDDEKVEESSVTTSLLKERDVLLKEDYRGYPTSSWNQFVVLLGRVYHCMVRDPMLCHLRALSNILVGCLMGCLYYKIGNDAMKVYSNVSFLFFTLLFMLFSAHMPTLLTFPLEMSVFIREQLNGWYSARMYYLAKTIADFPFQVLFPLLYCCIIYWLTEQPFETYRFVLFYLMCVVISCVSQAFAVMIGAAVNIQNAVYLGPLLMLPMLIFCGFFLPIRDMPSYMHWVTYLSFFRYAFEGAMIIIYGYKRGELDCDPESLCIFIEPQSFLDELGVHELSVSTCFIILSVNFFFYRIMGFLVLLYKLHFRK